PLPVTLFCETPGAAAGAEPQIRPPVFPTPPDPQTAPAAPTFEADLPPRHAVHFPGALHYEPTISGFMIAGPANEVIEAANSLAASALRNEVGTLRGILAPNEAPARDALGRPADATPCAAQRVSSTLPDPQPMAGTPVPVEAPMRPRHHIRGP